ncbi:MAG: hypothetical protein WBW53_05985, partial [Terriglobales bacterium]
TEAFSQASSDRLQEAQAETKAGFASLRHAANFTAREAQVIRVATERMQAKIQEIDKSGDALDAAFAHRETVLGDIEALRIHLEIYHPHVRGSYDAAEIEQLFSVFYTTELERQVLRAALREEDLPLAPLVSAASTIELF